ncbi:Chymotrypsin-like elastase family member 2A [Trichinella pseudospiralis]|uniref:Chymotrypsin-like elastase family member 2A n=2 Tax=Trichinella pseudospiralis TaxID=6337 RepID=A0A0V1J6J5_TRIPS|nr:Chymotrypsin-like elastase family member 2A [Trichinella pseudospiralis]
MNFHLQLGLHIFLAIKAASYQGKLKVGPITSYNNLRMRKMKQFFILINLLLCCITEIKSSLENCGKLKSNFLFPHPDPSNMMKRYASEPNSLPFMVRLTADMSYRGIMHINQCSGSLLPNGDANFSNTVLTSGHCLLFENDLYHKQGVVYAKFGVHRLDISSSEVLSLKSNNYFVQPLFLRWHTEAYDIGIVKFSTPVLFNHSIQPICLPSFHNYQPDFRECYTAGWRGVGGNSNLYWKFLSQMRLKVIECKHKHRLTSFSVLKPICADGLINGQYIYDGDSGSPLFCLVNNTWIQYGILSSTFAPCDQVTEIVFTAVWNYLRTGLNKRSLTMTG